MNQIVGIDEINTNASTYTFCNLNVKYKTGRAIDKTHYRHGVMCEIGDIEQSIWEELVFNLIIRSGEQSLYENLCTWYKKFPWLCSSSEIKSYVLGLHARRIFDDKKWVDYKECNKLYRPEIFAENKNGLTITNGFMFFFEEDESEKEKVL